MLDFILCQILLYFVQLFPYMFMGFDVRVECESLVKNCEDSEVRDWTTRKRPREKHMQESKQSFSKLHFTSHFAT